MKKGWVSSTHWGAGDSIATIEVTSIPGDPDPVANALSVVNGTKVYCTLTESNVGEITAATITSGLTWPASTAAQLSGGDSSGSAGVRYIRLCEIVTVDGSVKVKVLHTGNIEHSAATLSDNATSTYSTGDGFLHVRRWMAVGFWAFRGTKKGNGQLTLTQGSTENEIRGNLKKGKITYTIGAASAVTLVNWNDGLMLDGSDEEDPGAPVVATPYNIPIPAAYVHPWKVTDGGGGNAAIAAGFLQGYYLVYAAADPNIEPATDGIKVPESIVAGFSASYAGGTLAITGTKYIYAEIPRNGPTTEYSESVEVGDVTVFAELYDDLSPSPGDTATLVASDDGPETYPSSTGNAARCIAKVTNAAGVITVDAQYVHNNPDMFLPVINVGGNLAITP